MTKTHLKQRHCLALTVLFWTATCLAARVNSQTGGATQTTAAKISAQSKIQQRYGGFYFEPGFALETGRTSSSYPMTNSAGSSDGFGVLVRAGYELRHFIIAALDWRMALTQFHDAALDYTANATSANWAVLGGLQIPNTAVRGWIEYIFAGTLNPSAAGSGLDLRYGGATGYRFGLGYKFATDTSANIEYQLLRYNQTRVEQSGPYTGVNFNGSTLGDASLIAGVSFPLEF